MQKVIKKIISNFENGRFTTYGKLTEPLGNESYFQKISIMDFNGAHCVLHFFERREKMNKHLINKSNLGKL